MKEASPTDSRANPWVQILAAAVPTVLGQYLGATLLIPSLAGALAWWVMEKWFHPREAAYVPALAIIFGHMAWMVVAAIVRQGGLDAQVEIAIYAVAWLWLWRRPGLWPLGFIAVSWFNGIYWHVQEVQQFEWGSLEHKTVATHLTLRLLVVLFACIGLYVTITRRSSMPQKPLQSP